MLRNRVYYRFKPLIPAWVRVAVRRRLAVRKRARVRNVWPILPGSEKAPEGWSGWPDGKQFALVLTHDVEGQVGVDRCRQLMKLEMELGFRSCYNFIPEGDYRVPRDLIEELKQNGFEVGVHDLNHDGKLYSSRAEFAAKAVRINQHLKDWGAVGFRSGFMLRQLDWLHDLNVLYDCSTFDTDPFEPQPDGVGTIFPFWVPSPRHPNPDSEERGTEDGGLKRADNLRHFKRGYVELPYTLPQDFTLFMLFRERGIDVWRNKLKWISDHGGMAMVNVHPDYIHFSGEPASARTFSVNLYEAFLKEVRSQYDGHCWNALPSEVAARQSHESKVLTRQEFGSSGGSGADAPHPCLSGRRAAAVMFSHFPSDPRPQRAAEVLARQGVSIDVICLQGNRDEPRREVINGINVSRVPMRRRRGGSITYLLQYSAFILAAFFRLSFASLRRRYDLVHVHNMPDILVFSALVPKALGAKVILDLHDPMPELMLTIYKLQPESFGVRILKQFEKWSVRFADLVVTVNMASKSIYSSRSCVRDKVHIVMNSPDDGIFQFRQAASPAPGSRDPASPFVIMYHGSLLSRNGFDIAVEALESVRRSIPGAKLLVCGERTSFFDEVMAGIQKRGLVDAVEYLGRRNPRQIVEAIDRCDLGVIPNRRNIFTEMNTPTRIFEYLARGKPVIAPRARGIQDYFEPEDLVYFELGDAGDLARKIEFIHSHPDEVREIVMRGQKVYLQHTWSREKSEFVDAVGELLMPGFRAQRNAENGKPLGTAEIAKS